MTHQIVGKHVGHLFTDFSFVSRAIRENVNLYIYIYLDRDHRNYGSSQTSDDESLNDNVSVTSEYSDARSTDEVDEQSQQEAFEEKLTEAVDGFAQKSAQGRTSCLEAVSKAFIKKYVPLYVSDRCAYILTMFSYTITF